MKNKKYRCLSVLLSVALLFETFGMRAAAYNSPDSTSLENNVNLENSTSPEDSEGLENSTSPEDFEGLEGFTGTTDAQDSLFSTEAPNMDDVKELFPGLPDSYEFSEEQMNQKEILADYTESTISSGDIPSIVSAPHAEDEIVYLTESREDAQLVAEAFGGTLESYAYDVAVITLPETATVMEAVTAAADEESALPAVWPNYYKTIYEEYSDPALSEASEDYQWQHGAVGDIYAWNAGYMGQGVKVAILDTGILSSHEEFKGRLAEQLDMTGNTIVSGANDVHGHGTHVAGIIAANVNNGAGGAGIAPLSSLYIYRVADSSGNIDSASEHRAINRALSDGVDIINMSFGTSIYDGNEEIIMRGAYNAGVALFASAGNDSSTGQNYPAAYDPVCSIASSQQDGTKSWFSNYNKTVDLLFPGTGIYSTSYLSDNDYTYKSGTSMACPVAVGTAAVILSGAEDIATLSGKTGSDRVDALFALMKKNTIKSDSTGTGAGTTYLPKVFGINTDSLDATPQTPNFSIKSKTTIAEESAKLTITCASKANIQIYYTTNGRTPVWKNGKIKTGTLYTSAITIGNAKKMTVKAIAVNVISGKVSKVSTATYRFSPRPAGVSIKAAGGVNRLSPGTSLRLSASVYPEFATAPKASWLVTPSNCGVKVGSNGKVSVSSNATPGTYTVFARVSAPDDILTDTYEITVIPPSAPIKSVKFEQKRFIMNLKSGSTDGQDIFGLWDSEQSDPSLLTIKYAGGKLGTAADLVFSSRNPAVASISDTGLVTAVSPGTTVITATANDGSGSRDTCFVTVRQPAKRLFLSGSDKLVAGRSITLKASFLPENVSSTRLKWNVTGTGVTVKDGKVTASRDASGTCIVSATAMDGSGIGTYHTITILPSPIKAIKIPSSLNLFITAGSYNSPTSYHLEAEITGGDSSAITYYSSAPGIATVDADGTIHAVSRGKAEITCAATDGSRQKATCLVTVSSPISRLTIVPPDNNSGNVCVGSTLQLKVKIGTSYGKPNNPRIKWSVKKESQNMITINKSGLVRAKSMGTNTSSNDTYSTAYVVAKATDGSGASATFAVRIYRHVADFKLTYQTGGYFIPQAVFDDKTTSYTLPYQTIITTSKPVAVGQQKTYYTDPFGGKTPAFCLTIADPTTLKTSAQSAQFTERDGIRVRVTVQLEPNKKKVSKYITLIKTADEKIYFYI